MSPHAGEIVANFIFGTFVTGLSCEISGGCEVANTGSYVAIDHFKSKKLLPSYVLTIGNVVLQSFDVSVPFFGFPAEAFGWPDVGKS